MSLSRDDGQGGSLADGGGLFGRRLRKCRNCKQTSERSASVVLGDPIYGVAEYCPCGGLLVPIGGETVPKVRAVQERLDLTVQEVRDWIADDGDAPETLLQALIDAAKEDADAYLNNPFLDEEGEPEPIPAAVKVGVLKLIDHRYQRRTAGATHQTVTGLGTVIWSDALKDVQNDWAPYRRNPGL